MNKSPTSTAEDPDEEIAALVRKLHETQQRLQELTGGEVDAVIHPGGQFYLLEKAQKQFRESEEKFRQLADHITDVFWITSPDSKAMHYVSAGFKLIWGRSTESLYADPHLWIEAIVPEDRERVAGVFGTLMGDAAEVSAEYRIARPDGSVRWVHDRGFQVRDATGGVVRLTGIATDITERKRTESALEQLTLRTTRRERMLNAALSSMSDFAQIYDREGRLLFVNQPLLKLWGLTLEAAVGKNFHDLGYPPELAGKLQRQLQETFETKHSITDETPYVSPTGVDGYYEYIFSPVFTSEGTVDLVVGSTRDVTERKKSEAKLRQSQKRLRDIIDGMGPSMFVGLLTPQGILIEVNQSPLTAAGLKSEDVLGKPFDETPWWSQSPAAREQLRGAIAQAARGVASRYNVRTHGVGNAVIDIDFSLQPLRDDDGESIFIVASASVITERKQAEESLRKSEAEFRSLAEAMPQMVWITRPNGWNLYFSQQWMDYTGLALEESLGHGWNKPFHPEDQQRAWDAWQHATSTISTYSIECRLRRADGVYRWWLIRGVPQRDTAGNILKWFGTCTDIHDLKLAELEIIRTNRELRETEAKYRSLFENSNDGIFQTTPNGGFISANPALARILGFASPEELIRERTDIARQGYAEPTLREEFKRLVEERGFITGFEYEVSRKDGANIWVSENTRIVRDAAGAALYYEGSMQNISLRKQNDAALEKANNERIDASRRAGMAEVATGVLHNVGNVLNSVNVSVTLVVDQIRQSKAGNIAKLAALLDVHKADLVGFFTKDTRGQLIPGYLASLAESMSAEQKALIAELEHLRASVEHIKDIVATQQSFARTSGILETVSVPEMIEYALRINGGALLRGGVQTIRDYQPQLSVITDKHRVLQIVINLVRNAQQACEESGRSDKIITVRLTGDSCSVTIAVIDNGVGIPAENLVRIFAHGFSTKKSGHGFGLHSCALAATELGGSISVKSEGKGHGASFLLKLPLAHQRPA